VTKQFADISADKCTCRRDCDFVILSARCPVSEMFCQRTGLSAKRLVTIEITTDKPGIPSASKFPDCISQPLTPIYARVPSLAISHTSDYSAGTWTTRCHENELYKLHWSSL